MSDTDLTVEEQATNNITWRHINRVRELLNLMIRIILKRSELHDQSKLKKPEVTIFTEFTEKLATSTYGSEEYKNFLAEMKPALDHHYEHNRHHPEHFKGGVNGMNLIDMIEMLCDWKAASERHNDGDIFNSIKINTKRFNLSPQLVDILTNTANILFTK